MAINKKLKIMSLGCVNNFLNLENVVRAIFVRLTIENDGENNTVPQTVHWNFPIYIPLPYDTSTFVPYDQITLELATQWVNDNINGQLDSYQTEAESTWLEILRTNYYKDSMQIQTIQIT